MFQIDADAIPISRRIHMRVEPEADMESPNADVLGILALGGGLGMLLVFLAERYSLLEQRDRSRCPACGVRRRRGVCACD